MNKYKEALQTLFKFATHNDRGEKDVNDSIYSELDNCKRMIENLIDAVIEDD